ncbi:MAG: mRNA-degrading endonuclease RelE of RelBE toxin-antitoxin system [Arenicella sp.]|jgi:mRNA-degrading endonuclease RelE of RelBE toxin-antitoxin system
MSYEIRISSRFAKDLKKLAKKHLSIKSDLSKLRDMLLENPSEIGASLGNDCYKIRMAITSKGKGKSGGARIITHVKVIEETVYLLSIYDKSDASTISDSEIKEILDEIEE